MREQGRRRRFRGVYWRQLFVTVGIVLFALALVGAGFFSLGYQYVKNRKIQELRNQGMVMSRLASSYLRSAEENRLYVPKPEGGAEGKPRLSEPEAAAEPEGAAGTASEGAEASPTEAAPAAAEAAETAGTASEKAPTAARKPVSKNPDTGRRSLTNPVQYNLSELADVAAEVTDIQFLFCGRDGTIYHYTGTPPSETVMPAALTAEVLSGKSPAVLDDLDGLFAQKRLVAGVPVRLDGEKGEVVGAVYAVSAVLPETEWLGFVALFLATVCVVMLIAVLVSSLSAARMVTPLRKMVQTTRGFAEGDFTLRLETGDRDDEIEELAAAFNQMADFLQRQERQRRELIGNVSHDMKTPLTTIAGYTDGILDGTIPPSAQRHYLEIIAEESRRLIRLVKRMLDMSQIQAMDPVRMGAHFDICECMRQVLISLESRINARELDVDADIPEAPIEVLGDRDMMTQVVYNLLENAVKFARPGSTLYLGTRRVGEDRARVAVRNEGDTIPPEELPRLFDRFHKGDASRSADRDGVGLGLYIVKTILEQHREKIYVTSEDGVTEFSFSLHTLREARQYDI